MNPAEDVFVPKDVWRYILKSSTASDTLICCLQKMKAASKAFKTLAEEAELELVNEKKIGLFHCLPLKTMSQIILSKSPYDEMAQDNKSIFQGYVTKHPHALKILDLRHIFDWKNGEIQEMLRVQTRLEALYMTHLDPDPQTISLICGLAKLKHLQILYTDQMGQKRLKAVRKSHHLRLETIYIQGTGITSASVQELVQFKLLRKLTLKTCIAIKDQEMERLIKNLQDLKVLNIITSRISDYSLEQMNRLKRLKRLKLIGCGNLQNLSSLAALTQLEVLTLGRCSQVTSFDFLNQLQHLRVFKMLWYKSIPFDKRPDVKLLAERGVKLCLKS